MATSVVMGQLFVGYIQVPSSRIDVFQCYDNHRLSQPESNQLMVFLDACALTAMWGIFGRVLKCDLFIRWNSHLGMSLLGNSFVIRCLCMTLLENP